MTVGEIMTREVVTVGPDRSLASIQQLFDKKSFTHLVVVTEVGEVIGMITMRDLLEEVSPFVETMSERERDARTLERRAHQIMTHRPMSCRENDDVILAAERLLELDVSSFPVLNEEDELVGLITRTDFIRHFLDTR